MVVVTLPFGLCPQGCGVGSALTQPHTQSVSLCASRFSMNKQATDLDKGWSYSLTLTQYFLLGFEEVVCY